MKVIGSFKGGGARDPPPWASKFFIQFLGKIGKIVCWRPLEGWRSHFGEILDPPLIIFLAPITLPNDVTC